MNWYTIYFLIWRHAAGVISQDPNRVSFPHKSFCDFANVSPGLCHHRMSVKTLAKKRNFHIHRRSFRLNSRRQTVWADVLTVSRLRTNILLERTPRPLYLSPDYLPITLYARGYCCKEGYVTCKVRNEKCSNRLDKKGHQDYGSY